jgi:hypothetical protein
MSLHPAGEYEILRLADSPDECYAEARRLPTENRHKLDRSVQELLARGRSTRPRSRLAPPAERQARPAEAGINGSRDFSREIACILVSAFAMLLSGAEANQPVVPKQAYTTVAEP